MFFFFFSGGGGVAIYESHYNVTNSFMLLIQDCTLKRMRGCTEVQLVQR